MGDRCTGNCCRAFYVPPLAWEKAACGDPEGLMVVGMIRALLPGSFLEQLGRSLTGDEFGKFFTCTHLGPDGDCGIYVTRPAMCSKYPYGKRCNYPGCTWDEARALPDTEPIQTDGAEAPTEEAPTC